MLIVKSIFFIIMKKIKDFRWQNDMFMEDFLKTHKEEFGKINEKSLEKNSIDLDLNESFSSEAEKTNKSGNDKKLLKKQKEKKEKREKRHKKNKKIKKKEKKI